MNRLRSFEPKPWTRDRTDPVPISRIKIPLTAEHIEEATWSLYHNPVSVALRPHLNEHTVASLFWNSDSFGPRYFDDDARIGIHIENADGESNYWLPLPVRATRAMWLLRSRGLPEFRPLTISLDLPTAALAANPPARVPA